MRTVELGVTFTDAIDGDTTVVFCNLLDDGQRDCPGCGGEGIYSDTVIRKTDRCAGGRSPAAAAVPRYRCTNTTVSGKCSPTTRLR